MCMAFIKQKPSFIPLFSTIFLTSGVMLINARLVGVLNVRYSVLDFILFEKNQCFVYYNLSPSPGKADVVSEHPEPVLTKEFRYEKYAALGEPMYSGVLQTTSTIDKAKIETTAT